MNFETIETSRLLLKGISAEEMKFIFETYSKTDIKMILGHRSEEEYQADEYKHKNGYSSYNRTFKLFFLTDKTTHAIIGRCGLHNWNVQHRRAEVGYVMGEENYKRKGLMTEALGAVLEYGFNSLNLNRIEALVGNGNLASLRLMKKFRFVQEGVLKQHYYTNSQFEDSILFALLKQDYR